MEHVDLMQIWRTVTDTLHRDYAVTEAVLEFLKLSRPISVIDNEFLVMAPNDLTKRMIEERLRTPVVDVLQQRLKLSGLRLRVIVDPVALEEIARQESHRQADPDPNPRTDTHTESADTRTERAGTVRPTDSTDPTRPTDPADSTSASTEPAEPATPPTPAASEEPSEDGPERSIWVQRVEALERERLASRGSEPELDEVLADDRLTVVPSPTRPPTRTKPAAEPAHLNPRYTFDSFVIGSSNRFAHAAAVAVAEAPAQAYNPLFIYGESGLGKTHLLHAIGHYSQNLYPHQHCRFVNSEEFTNEFINSIRDDRAQVFQQRYRAVDLLLIDDIQFLQGKVQTQEEFFHTFNALHQANKQVVITADVAPRKLSGFEERMRTRFEWGLLTDIQPPDLETRIAILRKKAAADRLDAPDDVLEYIGSNVTTNIRELEGALIRVTAFANLSKEPLTLLLAQKALKDLLGEQATEITAGRIIAKTAEYFDLTEDDLIGPSRSRTLVIARQIAMYLCREHTDLSFPKIGAAFGGRDHSTVIHALDKVRKLMAEKHSIYQQVTDLAIRIKQA